jgi:hypothetical protein
LHPAVKTKTQFCCSLPTVQAAAKPMGGQSGYLSTRARYAAGRSRSKKAAEHKKPSSYGASGLSVGPEGQHIGVRVFPSWNRRGGRAIKKCREATFERRGRGGQLRRKLQ